jgi:hypothetical protein
MSKLREIEARLDRAFARIDAAMATQQAVPANGTGDGRSDGRSDALATLRAELDRLRDERRRDADDVSAILADLRPLLET